MNQWENLEQDELIALARLDIEQGRVEQGLLKLKYLLAAGTVQPEVLSMAARLYAQLALFDRAQPLYEQYLQLRPDAFEEEFQLGMVKFDKGEGGQALETWERVMKRQPTFPPGLFFSAVVLRQQGKIADARRNLDVLLQTAPNDNLYYGRGQELLQAIERDVVQQSPAPMPVYQAS